MFPTDVEIPFATHPIPVWCLWQVTTAWRESAIISYPVMLAVRAREGFVAAGKLTKLFAGAYTSILADSKLRSLKSAVAATLASSISGTGHGFVSLPDRCDENTEAIVFLHGQGGNLLFNLWRLRRSFPEAILLLPSWSFQWPAGSEKTVLSE